MPKAIEIILLDGNPNGIKKVNLVGWPGTCYIVPRINLKNFSFPSDEGIYFLIGEDDNGVKSAYIGKTENYNKRIPDHDKDKDKDFWDQAILFTGTPDGAFLEASAIKLARDAKRFSINNRKDERIKITDGLEAVRSENFFEGLKDILSVLGYPIFQRVEDVDIENIYYYKGKGDKKYDASAKALDNGEMVVIKESILAEKEAQALSGRLGSIRRWQIIHDKLATQNEDGTYILTEDIICNNPSLAASIVCGFPVNGWDVWKDKNGKTLDENIRK